LNFECGTAKLAKKFQVHKITVPYKFFFILCISFTYGRNS